MSFKTTNKEVNRCYLTFRCGYCSAQNIFNYEEPIAHTEGIYGWNSDIYVRGGMAISTGYRPTGMDGYQSLRNTTKKQRKSDSARNFRRLISTKNCKSYAPQCGANCKWNGVSGLAIL